MATSIGRTRGYDVGWAKRETDVHKLRSQITLMARQLKLQDDIDQHNREVNDKLRAALGLAASGELEDLVAQWLRGRGYRVAGGPRENVTRARKRLTCV